MLLKWILSAIAVTALVLLFINPWGKTVEVVYRDKVPATTLAHTAETPMEVVNPFAGLPKAPRGMRYVLAENEDHEMVPVLEWKTSPAPAAKEVADVPSGPQPLPTPPTGWKWIEVAGRPALDPIMPAVVASAAPTERVVEKVVYRDAPATMAACSTAAPMCGCDNCQHGRPHGQRAVCAQPAVQECACNEGDTTCEDNSSTEVNFLNGLTLFSGNSCEQQQYYPRTQSRPRAQYRPQQQQPRMRCPPRQQQQPRPQQPRPCPPQRRHRGR